MMIIQSLAAATYLTTAATAGSWPTSLPVVDRCVAPVRRPTAPEVNFDWNEPSNHAMLSGPRQQFLRQLERYRALQVGWSGTPDSVPPCNNTMEEVRDLLWDFPEAALQNARLALSPDGEISLIWDSGKSRYAELSLAGDGILACYVEEQGVPIPAFQQDIHIHAMPTTLRKYIVSHFV